MIEENQATPRFSAISLIASSKRSERYKRNSQSTTFDGGSDGHLEVGEDLTMTNGTVWFHPYSGGAPRRIR
jgi:hypothetical protein